MKKFLFLFFLFIFPFIQNSVCAQSWVDSLDNYAREKHLPPNRYWWTWQNAALLKVMVMQYELRPQAEKQQYFDYIKEAMDGKLKAANGKTPNAVASGLGMAFMYRQTGEQKYLDRCEKIYRDYLAVRRTEDGAVSHLRWYTELWDDTVFMIGQFLLEMYRATGDEKYLDEFMLQFRTHRDKLRDATSNLWVHGWDADDKNHFCFCSQIGWADKKTRASKEIWGRGNGWIIVTLSDVLRTLPKEHEYWNECAGYLKEMVTALPELQDELTGHWYQLAMKPGLEGNFIESSATAMFAYGITTAIQFELIHGDQYNQSIDRAYAGLRKHSIRQHSENYLINKNVCKGTCIGDEKYYLKRSVKDGRSYGLGSFIQFGLQYEFLRGLRIQ